MPPASGIAHIHQPAHSVQQTVAICAPHGKLVCKFLIPAFVSRAMNLMSLLRAVSLTEGVSYLVLLLVAMPLKYLWEQPLMVKWVGWAHGVLFMALGALLLLAMWRAALPFRLAVIVGVAALLPAGPFFADRLLKRHQQSIAD